ncbi:MAG: HD domain-containing protein [Desulfobacteraceae bacterium]|nr:HD domain-containing protein [Desulfobacteraceae bacterium]
MKKQFIDQLKAGDAIDDIFILAEKNLSHTRDGKPYLTLELSDKSGHAKGVAWDRAEQLSRNASSGDPVAVRGQAGEYKGNLQIVVKSLEPVPAEGYDPADFMPVTTRNIDVMYDRLVNITRNFETDYLRSLFELFWADDEFVAKFKRAPAAKKMHHAYIGGLLEHILSMAVLADKVSGHYSGIDRELLIAGVILHDVGKVREFNFTLNIDYSDEGRFLSHIVIGVQMVDEKIKSVDGFPVEKANLLKHMIISHHGEREFGSPEPPKTIEAVMLHFIDDIDSKVNSIRDYMTEDETDENWTRYHRLLERHFYKGTPGTRS